MFLQCTRLILHVVPMMFYILAYFVLLVFSLMGILLCSCSQIIQIYACTLIGWDELFIDRLYLYLSLLDVFVCTMIGGGILYLRCKVPL